MGCPVSMIGLYAGAEINCKSGCSLSMLSSGSRKFVSTLESQLWFDSQFDFDRMAYTFFSSWSGVCYNIAWSDRCKELPPNAEICIPHSRLQNYSHRCYFGLQGSVLRGLMEPGMGTPLCMFWHNGYYGPSWPLFPFGLNRSPRLSPYLSLFLCTALFSYIFQYRYTSSHTSRFLNSLRSKLLVRVLISHVSSYLTRCNFLSSLSHILASNRSWSARHLWRRQRCVYL